MWNYKLLIWLLLLCSQLFGNYSIIFVHLGPILPPYIFVSIEQARLFNPDASIYLIAEQKAIDDQYCSLRLMDRIIQIPTHALPMDAAHITFNKTSSLSEGFWRSASERFFYLHALIKSLKLSNVFHLENDVMLYQDLSEILPIFENNYNGLIAATFDNEERCIPGFVYISCAKPLEALTQFIAKHSNLWDMQSLPLFKVAFSNYIDSLPIVTPEYIEDHPLISSAGYQGIHPNTYINHFDQFNSVFDAAALGQYLGGVNPAILVSSPGFINESCIFNPSYFDYIWKIDEQQRRVPYIVYKNCEYKINNLHIHCKNLKSFSSKIN